MGRGVVEVVAVKVVDTDNDVIGPAIGVVDMLVAALHCS